MIHIIGPGRSGTTLCVQVLGALGFDAGPRLTRYWEDPEVWRLNEAILARFGGDFWHPPELPEDWIEGCSDLTDEAAAITADGREVIKDPRLSMLAPFWRRVAEPTATICCSRDPDGFAASLQRRDGTDIGEARRLWGVWTLAALEQRPDLIIDFTDWFDRPGPTVAALAATVGAEADGTVLEVIDPAGDHHREASRV